MDISPVSEQPDELHSPVRHNTFYFDDRTVIFQVENTLLKVPIRHFLAHSPIFSQMLECTPGEGKSEEGCSDLHPLKLPDSLDDFVALINYFNRDLVEFEGSKSQWISILRLADKYQMDQLHRMAYTALEEHKLGVFEMLDLAPRYHIPIGWAGRALHYLVHRSEPITVKESFRLQPGWTAAIVWDWIVGEFEKALNSDKEDLDAIVPSHIEEEPPETPPRESPPLISGNGKKKKGKKKLHSSWD